METTILGLGFTYISVGDTLGWVKKWKLLFGFIFFKGKYGFIPWSKEIILLRLSEECANGRRLYVGG